jgi:hypothetical protein
VVCNLACRMLANASGQAYSGPVMTPSGSVSAMSQASSVQRKPYIAPSIRDYGDLLEVTATVGGTFSDVPQGSPSGTGCGGGPSCFS